MPIPKGGFGQQIGMTQRTGTKKNYLVVKMISNFLRCSFVKHLTRHMHTHMHIHTSSSSPFNVHNFPLRWGWMGDLCLPQLAIMCHVFLYSQGVHILCQTCSLLFPGPSHWPSAYNPHFLCFIQQTSFCPSYMSKPSQSSLPHFNREVLHISLTSVLDFPSCHFTPATHIHTYIHTYIIYLITQVSVLYVSSEADVDLLLN